MKNSMEWPDGKETGGFFSSLRVIAKKKIYIIWGKSFVIQIQIPPAFS